MTKISNVDISVETPSAPEISASNAAASTEQSDKTLPLKTEISVDHELSEQGSRRKQQKGPRRIAITLLLTSIIAIFVGVSVSKLLGENDADDNEVQEQGQRCLQTLGRHKPEPSGEELFNCNAFEENSCCTYETTKTLVSSSSNHVGPFNWSKCGGVSPQCEQFIKNEMCFYYCSPNTYPWAEKILPTSEVHPEDVGETYSQVPICSSYCDSFYEACKDEPICVTNWYSDWEVRTNEETGQVESHCSADSTCDTFGQRFENGSAMCNGIFGDSYISTPGTPGVDCLVMTFPDSNNNPNNAVSASFSE